MRNCYNGFTNLRDKITKEAEVRDPTTVRRNAIVELSDTYKEVETMYLDAFHEADEKFKDVNTKVNKQQIEKEILDMVKEIQNNQEHLKNAISFLMELAKANSSTEMVTRVESSLAIKVPEEESPPPPPFGDGTSTGAVS